MDAKATVQALMMTPVSSGPLPLHRQLRQAREAVTIRALAALKQQLAAKSGKSPPVSVVIAQQAAFHSLALAGKVEKKLLAGGSGEKLTPAALALVQKALATPASFLASLRDCEGALEQGALSPAAVRNASAFLKRHNLDASSLVCRAAAEAKAPAHVLPLLRWIAVAVGGTEAERNDEPEIQNRASEVSVAHKGEDVGNASSKDVHPEQKEQVQSGECTSAQLAAKDDVPTLQADTSFETHAPADESSMVGLSVASCSGSSPLRNMEESFEECSPSRPVKLEEHLDVCKANSSVQSGECTSTQLAAKDVPPLPADTPFETHAPADESSMVELSVASCSGSSPPAKDVPTLQADTSFETHAPADESSMVELSVASCSASSPLPNMEGSFEKCSPIRPVRLEEQLDVRKASSSVQHFCLDDADSADDDGSAVLAGQRSGDEGAEEAGSLLEYLPAVAQDDVDVERLSAEGGKTAQVTSATDHDESLAEFLEDARVDQVADFAEDDAVSGVVEDAILEDSAKDAIRDADAGCSDAIAVAGVDGGVPTQDAGASADVAGQEDCGEDCAPASVVGDIPVQVGSASKVAEGAGFADSDESAKTDVEADLAEGVAAADGIPAQVSSEGGEDEDIEEFAEDAAPDADADCTEVAAVSNVAATVAEDGDAAEFEEGADHTNLGDFEEETTIANVGGNCEEELAEASGAAGDHAPHEVADPSIMVDELQALGIFEALEVTEPVAAEKNELQKSCDVDACDEVAGADSKIAEEEEFGVADDCDGMDEADLLAAHKEDVLQDLGANDHNELDGADPVTLEQEDNLQELDAASDCDDLEGTHPVTTEKEEDLQTGDHDNLEEAIHAVRGRDEQELSAACDSYGALDEADALISVKEDELQELGVHGNCDTLEDEYPTTSEKEVELGAIACDENEASPAVAEKEPELLTPGDAGDCDEVDGAAAAFAEEEALHELGVFGECDELQGSGSMTAEKEHESQELHAAGDDDNLDGVSPAVDAAPATTENERELAKHSDADDDDDELERVPAVIAEDEALRELGIFGDCDELQEADSRAVEKEDELQDLHAAGDDDYLNGAEPTVAEEDELLETGVHGEEDAFGEEDPATSKQEVADACDEVEAAPAIAALLHLKDAGDSEPEILNPISEEEELGFLGDCDELQVADPSITEREGELKDTGVSSDNVPLENVDPALAEKEDEFVFSDIDAGKGVDSAIDEKDVDLHESVVLGDCDALACEHGATAVKENEVHVLIGQDEDEDAMWKAARFRQLPSVGTWLSSSPALLRSTTPTTTNVVGSAEASGAGHLEEEAAVSGRTETRPAIKPRTSTLGLAKRAWRAAPVALCLLVANGIFIASVLYLELESGESAAEL